VCGGEAQARPGQLHPAAGPGQHAAGEPQVRKGGARELLLLGKGRFLLVNGCLSGKG